MAYQVSRLPFKVPLVSLFFLTDKRKQAAYFSLYGRIESTYEPAMTKTFLHGRTEAIRSVTPECDEFVKVGRAAKLAGFVE